MAPSSAPSHGRLTVSQHRETETVFQDGTTLPWVTTAPSQSQHYNLDEPVLLKACFLTLTQVTHDWPLSLPFTMPTVVLAGETDGVQLVLHLHVGSHP